MTYRDETCSECRRVTGGDCGAHPTREVEQEIARLRAQLTEAETWGAAVQDAAVVDWTFDSCHTAREAVAALLAWQIKIALDPAVSEPARALHARVRELESDLIAAGERGDSWREQSRALSDRARALEAKLVAAERTSASRLSSLEALSVERDLQLARAEAAERERADLLDYLRATLRDLPHQPYDAESTAQGAVDKYTPRPPAPEGEERKR